MENYESYEPCEAQDNSAKIGKQIRRAIVHPEGHMDDAFAVARSQGQFHFMNKLFND